MAWSCSFNLLAKRSSDGLWLWWWVKPSPQTAIGWETRKHHSITALKALHYSHCSIALKTCCFFCLLTLSLVFCHWPSVTQNCSNARAKRRGTSCSVCSWRRYSRVLSFAVAEIRKRALPLCVTGKDRRTAWCYSIVTTAAFGPDGLVSLADDTANTSHWNCSPVVTERCSMSHATQSNLILCLWALFHIALREIV